MTMATVEIAPRATPAVLQEIPLGALYPSPTNPRKHFDPKRLQELADNIESVGLIEPLIVRRNPAQDDRASYDYEVVAGGRRYRALQLLKAASAPCIVRDLSDEEVREAQISENLQREDVHPLEEAEGYRELMELNYGPIADAGSEKGRVHVLASKFGKSSSYIYARLKLASLNELAKTAFRERLISPGHAVLIARLVYHDQIRVLGAVLSVYEASKLKPGLETHKLEEKVVDILQEVREARRDGNDLSRMSEKSLREWIQENVNLDLAEAPWKLDDASLLPRAGACADCQKHTKANPDLYRVLGDKKHDYCMDSICFHEKRMALVNIRLQGGSDVLQLDSRQRYSAPKADAKIYFRGQWVQAKKGSCPDTVQGVIARGDGMGEAKYVCVAAKCKTHPKSWIGGTNGARSAAPARDHEKERELREAREKKEDVVRGRLVSAILEKITRIGDRELKLLAAAIVEDARLWASREFFAEKFGTAEEGKLGESLQNLGASSTSFARLLMALILSGQLHQYDPKPTQRKELLGICRQYQVNADKIIAQCEFESKKPTIAISADGETKVKLCDLHPPKKGGRK